MVYRGSIARRLIWLSTLRRGSYPPTTQDSLPAAGPALPDGIGYPQGSLRKVSSLELSSFPGLTWRKVGPGKRFSLDIHQLVRMDTLYRSDTSHFPSSTLRPCLDPRCIG